MVLFGKWSGTEVKLDGVEYLIMKESDIMGVIWRQDAQTGRRLKPAGHRLWSAHITRSISWLPKT